MTRRFIALLVALLAWPLAAHAQNTPVPQPHDSIVCVGITGRTPACTPSEVLAVYQRTLVDLRDYSVGLVTLQGNPSVYQVWVPVPPAGTGTSCFNWTDTSPLTEARNQGLVATDRITWVYPVTCPIGGATSFGSMVIALYGGLQGFEHEMGHAAGRVPHAPARVCNAGSCSWIEYGDYYDLMGGGPQFARFGHASAIYAGWIGAVPSLPVRTVTTSGIYTIATLDQHTLWADQALRVAVTQPNAPGAVELAIGARCYNGPSCVPLVTLYGYQPAPIRGQHWFAVDLDPTAGQRQGLREGQSFTLGDITVRVIDADAFSATVEITGLPSAPPPPDPCVVDPLVVSLPASAGHILTFTPFTVTDERGCRVQVTP